MFDHRKDGRSVRLLIAQLQRLGISPSARRRDITVFCEYPGGTIEPTDVTFRLSPRYGLTDAGQVHEWFLGMLREHDFFEVETDKPGELPMPFASETVRRVEVG